MVSSNGVINNKVGSSISGVTNTFTVTNASNTASSAARETILVGGGSAGDPTLNFNVSGVTNWEMGIDNSVSDNLTISQGTALGTNDVWRMTTAGERTMPLQPCFRAYSSVNLPNVTGDGSNYIVIFDSVSYDRGSDFNTATGTFTAPVLGVYIFVVNIQFSNLGAGNTQGVITVSSSSDLQVIYDMSSGTTRDANNNIMVSGSAMCLLGAGGTATVTVAVFGGAKTVGVTNGTDRSTFSGFLLC